MEDVLKTTEAETHLEVWLNCPHCDTYQDRIEELKEYFDHWHLSADSCEAELVCEEKSCKKKFVVNKIHY